MSVESALTEVPQAAGRAVVASNVGGIPECVRSGKTGLLVPPRDPDALAQAVTRLLGNPAERQKMIRAGRHWVQKPFCMERQATVIEAAFGRVVTKQARAA